MNDISQETARIAGRGFRMLAELMRKEGLLKFDQDGKATAYSNEMFKKAMLLWIQVFKEYISNIENIRKSEEQKYIEVAALVISQLPKSRLP